MSDFIEVVIVVIIIIQLFFFIKNLIRMFEFKNIFNGSESWSISRDITTSFVTGIGGGNDSSIFKGIKDSINMYLYYNKGSVIEFDLLKDAVDRHCDSIEDDINVQTPVPLYCGLAGTMIGVITGLVPLIKSGALMYLLNGGFPSEIQAAIAAGTMTFEEAKSMLDSLAAVGINDLLGGVAWAMGASICGIILTTINSVVFKSFKLKEESGKNAFLAWMQSKLLPLTPSNSSEALSNLVQNLNAFNETFASNATQLDTTLGKVNEVYKVQDDIIQAVQKMDVMKMAKANVQVLKQLNECTDKLEKFNEYLDSVKGYTDTIQVFNSQFNQESQRLHILEEIRDYFARHKGEIVKDTADADDALKQSLKLLEDSSVKNVAEFKKHLTDQTDAFGEIVQAQKDSFLDFCKDMKNTYADEMEQIPTIAKNMDVINEIPSKLESLIQKVEDSTARIEKSSAGLNDNVKKEVAKALDKLQKNKQQPIISEPGEVGNIPSEPPSKTLPEWFLYSILSCIVVITLFVVIGFSYLIFKSDSISRQLLEQPLSPIEEVAPIDTLDVDVISVDSVVTDIAE